MRRAARVDNNQSAIVKGLRQIGIAVEIIGKPVDLLVWHLGVTSIMEIKNADGFDRLTKDQIEFIARWPGPIHIVRNLDEAVAAVIGKEAMA